MANDLWRTPPEVMLYLKYNHGFLPTIDACADKDNRKCKRFFSEENSFLLVDPKSINGEQIWCNPPYSKPLPFVKQCIALSGNGNDVFMLLNMDTSTKWFELIEATENATVMPVVGGRIHFVNEKGEQITKNNKPQVFIYFCKHQTYNLLKADWEPINIELIRNYKE